jgi:hypothetical protein
MGQRLRERTITGENTFTDACGITSYFNISISGTWEGVVTVQRSFDLGSTWFDVATWTANTQEYGFEPEQGVQYRIGVKAGELTSGSPVLRISQ